MHIDINLRFQELCSGRSLPTEVAPGGELARHSRCMCIVYASYHVNWAASHVLWLCRVAFHFVSLTWDACSLLADGINPSNRLRMIPVALQTLGLSTLFTGILGSLGFLGLRSGGFFKQDEAELPSTTEALRLLRQPRVGAKTSDLEVCHEVTFTATLLLHPCIILAAGIYW